MLTEDINFDLLVKLMYRCWKSGDTRKQADFAEIIHTLQAGTQTEPPPSALELVDDGTVLRVLNVLVELEVVRIRYRSGVYGSQWSWDEEWVLN